MPETLTCTFGTPWLDHFDPPIGTGRGCEACRAQAVMIPRKDPMSTQNQAFTGLDERFERLPIDQVVISKTNPRSHFPETYLAQLADSIRDKGVIQPVLVRQVDAGSHKPMKFEIIAGECRYRATKIAGVSHIPAVIRQYSDEQVLELQLIENIHRNDLTPLEQAKGYRALIDSNPTKHSAESIAARIGMSPAWVWDRMKLLDLVPEAMELLEQERMTVNHAILLARLKPAEQTRAIHPDSGGLFEGEDAQLPEFDGRRDGKKPAKYDGHKVRTINELKDWIADHIRFDVQHAAKAAPLVFEPVAQQVEAAAAKPGRGKKVVPITCDYNAQSQAAKSEDERTYGATSWKRADGQEKSKPCEYAVRGLVVAGTERYGESFDVCIARDRCTVHWADSVKTKQQAAKLRESGKTKQAAKVEKKAEESFEAKHRREEAERQRRAQAWTAIADHVFDEAVAQVKKIKALTAKHAARILEDDYGLDAQTIQHYLGAQWFKTPGTALLVNAVATFNYSGWNTKKSGFDEYISEIGKPYGLDVKRLEAARDKHQPKAEPVQTSGVKGKKAGKAKAA